jgi:hypothetical protein
LLAAWACVCCTCAGLGSGKSSNKPDSEPVKHSFRADG